MKTALIILLCAVSFSVAAQQVHSIRNLSGGENFYSQGRYLGYTSPNLAGGRNFFPAQGAQQNRYYGPNYGYGFQGYHGSGNAHLQDGYAIGAGLSNIFNAFRSK